MNRLESIKIAFATDDNYVMPAVVAMTSLFENNPFEIDMFLLYIDGHLSEQSRSTIRNTTEKYGVQIHFASILPDEFDGIPVFRHGLSSLVRLFAAKKLPDIDKLLYLDCDIIVEGSIKDLYNTNIDNFTLAGVAEKRTENIKYLNKIGYHHNHRYYINSGVLLMNLKVLRELDIKQLIREYLNIYKDLIELADQDIINCVFPDIMMLSPKYNALPIFWNLMSSARSRLWKRDEIVECARQPIIIHYITTKKPWALKCRHVLTDRWFHYLKQTSFKEYKVPVKSSEMPVLVLRNLHIIGKKLVRLILIAKYNMGIIN